MKTRISDARVTDGQLIILVEVRDEDGGFLHGRWHGLPNDFNEKHIRQAQQNAVNDYCAFCQSTVDQAEHMKTATAEAEKALERLKASKFMEEVDVQSVEVGTVEISAV